MKILPPKVYTVKKAKLKAEGEKGRVVTISEGDLFLLHPGREDANPVLGVFSRIEVDTMDGPKRRGEVFIFEDPAYRLYPSLKQGDTTVPIAKPYATRPKDGLHKICLLTIKDLFVGERQVAKRCFELELWDHRNWISSLEKPYNFPELATQGYVVRAE